MSERLLVLNPGWAELERLTAEITGKINHGPTALSNDVTAQAEQDLGIKLHRGMTPRELTRLLSGFGITIENHTKHPQLVAPDKARRVFPGGHIGKGIPLGELKQVEKFANMHGTPRRH